MIKSLLEQFLPNITQMKSIKRLGLIAVMLLMLGSVASAQGVQDVLGGLLNGNNNSGNDGNSTLTNLIEGVFSRSNISTQDMMGIWKSNGPAVAFKSDNLLKKAGGLAAAAKIEKELSKYYKQYGLNGVSLTVNADATFEMKFNKLITLKGTITQSNEGKGIFLFNFKAFGSMKLGSLTTYVQKTSSSMDVMFDATKLKNLISSVAKLTGNTLAKSFGSLLDSYEGLCVGFRFDKTGTVSGENTNNNIINDIINGVTGGNSNNSNNSNNTNNTNTPNNPNSSNNSNNEGVGNALNGLQNILNGNKK